MATAPRAAVRLTPAAPPPRAAPAPADTVRARPTLPKRIFPSRLNAAKARARAPRPALCALRSLPPLPALLCPTPGRVRGAHLTRARRRPARRQAALYRFARRASPAAAAAATPFASVNADDAGAAAFTAAAAAAAARAPGAATLPAPPAPRRGLSGGGSGLGRSLEKTLEEIEAAAARPKARASRAHSSAAARRPCLSRPRPHSRRPPAPTRLPPPPAPPQERTREAERERSRESGRARRDRELADRQAYLKNFWYAAGEDYGVRVRAAASKCVGRLRRAPRCWWAACWAGGSAFACST